MSTCDVRVTKALNLKNVTALSLSSGGAELKGGLEAVLKAGSGGGGCGNR